MGNWDTTNHDPREHDGRRVSQVPSGYMETIGAFFYIHLQLESRWSLPPLIRRELDSHPPFSTSIRRLSVALDLIDSALIQQARRNNKALAVYV